MLHSSSEKGQKKVRNTEINRLPVKKERKKSKRWRFERQLLQSTVKLIGHWTVKRVEMRKEHESGSERSALRDGERERGEQGEKREWGAGEADY